MFEKEGFYIGFANTPEMFAIACHVAYHHEDKDLQFGIQIGWTIFCIGYTFGKRSTWKN